MRTRFQPVKLVIPQSGFHTGFDGFHRKLLNFFSCEQNVQFRFYHRAPAEAFAPFGISKVISAKFHGVNADTGFFQERVGSRLNVFKPPGGRKPRFGHHGKDAVSLEDPKTVFGAFRIQSEHAFWERANGFQQPAQKLIVKIKPRNHKVGTVFAQQGGGKNKIDKRAVVAQDHRRPFRRADFVYGFYPDTAEAVIDPQTKVHDAQHKAVDLRCFVYSGMCFGIAVELGEQNLPFADENDKQHHQHREYTEGNRAAGYNGHIAKPHADTNRGKRPQQSYRDVAAVAHPGAGGQKADHTVGNGRQEVKKKDQENAVWGSGDLFQIQPQLFNKEAAQPVAEAFLQQKDHGASDQNTCQAAQKTDSKTKR